MILAVSAINLLLLLARYPATTITQLLDGKSVMIATERRSARAFEVIAKRHWKCVEKAEVLSFNYEE